MTSKKRSSFAFQATSVNFGTLRLNAAGMLRVQSVLVRVADSSTLTIAIEVPPAQQVCSLYSSRNPSVRVQAFVDALNTICLPCNEIREAFYAEQVRPAAPHRRDCHCSNGPSAIAAALVGDPHGCAGFLVAATRAISSRLSVRACSCCLRLTCSFTAMSRRA